MRPEVSHLFLCVLCFSHFSLSSLLHFLHTIPELFRELFIGQLIRKLLRPANQIKKNVYKPVHYSQSTIINKCLKSGSDINGTLIFALLAERGGSATVKLSLFVFCHRLLHPLSPKRCVWRLEVFKLPCKLCCPQRKPRSLHVSSVLCLQGVTEWISGTSLCVLLISGGFVSQCSPYSRDFFQVFFPSLLIVDSCES